MVFPSEGNKARKKKWKTSGWKGKTKTISSYRWNNLILKKFLTNPVKAIRTNKWAQQVYSTWVYIQKPIVLLYTSNEQSKKWN